MNSNDRKYLLIGSGRLARHLEFFLISRNYRLQTWSRRESEQTLAPWIAEADVILLAISDHAIAEWVARPEFSGKTVVHFSGSRSFPPAKGLHPLMTFSNPLYPLDFYEGIPFVVEKKSDFEDVFPGLHNPVFEIPAEKKPAYHALCHMAANFPALLWVQLFNRFEQELNLPAEILLPMLEKILVNTLANRESSLAGPLVRGDASTIRLHQIALASDMRMENIYNRFTEWALKEHNI